MRRIVLLPLLVLAGLMVGTGTASAHVPFCFESVNPHGATVPPAGSTTLPGPNGGRTRMASTRSDRTSAQPCPS